MLEENTVPAEENATGTEAAKPEEKPTLETLAAQNRELNEKLKKVLKQNSDKDSHITKIQGENRELHEKIQTVSSSLEGKTEKQKDAVLERHREKFLEAGYDDKAVDLILNTITDIADRKAEIKVSKVVTDAALELIESDKDIDQEFVKNNEAEVMAEYNSYRLDEVSARKMKSNFKKAYNAVKDRLAEKAKGARKGKDEEGREAAIEGQKPTSTSKKAQTDNDLIESIESAGVTNSHFI